MLIQMCYIVSNDLLLDTGTNSGGDFLIPILMFSVCQ